MKLVNQDSGMIFDLQNRPARAESTGSTCLTLFLLVWGSGFGGIPALILAGSLFGGDGFKAEFLFLLPFMAIGLGAVFFGIYQRFSRTVTTLHEDRVTVESTTLFKKDEWSEPIENYRGVLRRSEYHSGGKNSSSYTLHIVELLHEDKEKTVRLYCSRSSEGWRAHWEECARALEKPALQLDGEQIVARNVEDLDKSIRDQVAEGNLEVNFDPSAPPPDGFVCRVADDAMVVEIPNRPGSDGKWVGTIIMMLIPLGILAIGPVFGGGGWFGSLIGLVFGAVIYGALIWACIATETLEIRPSGITRYYQTQWGAYFKSELAATEIEGVRIGSRVEGQQHGGFKCVTLDADSGSMSLAQGKSDEHLQWLYDCIVYVISS